MVFVKLQPYRQLSLKRHSYVISQVEPQVFGPCKVLQKIGTVAYQLELPVHAKIHNTFHVSQLKKHIDDKPAVPDLPVALSSHEHIILEPKSIVDTRKLQKGQRVLTQVLVK